MSVDTYVYQQPFQHDDVVGQVEFEHRPKLYSIYDHLECKITLGTPPKYFSLLLLTVSKKSKIKRHEGEVDRSFFFGFVKVSLV